MHQAQWQSAPVPLRGAKRRTASKKIGVDIEHDVLGDGLTRSLAVRKCTFCARASLMAGLVATYGSSAKTHLEEAAGSP